MAHQGREVPGMTDLTRAEFPASFPPIMSALLFGADGVRIKLDIPESHRAEATKLVQWQGQVLRVTVEPEKKEDGGQRITRKIHI